MKGGADAERRGAGRTGGGMNGGIDGGAGGGAASGANGGRGGASGGEGTVGAKAASSRALPNLEKSGPSPMSVRMALTATKPTATSEQTTTMNQKKMIADTEMKVTCAAAARSAEIRGGGREPWGRTPEVGWAQSEGEGEAARRRGRG